MVPREVARLRDLVAPRGYCAFAGVYQRTGLPLTTRLIYRLLGGGTSDDLRDWQSIRTWSTEIATTLGLRLAAVGPEPDRPG